MATMNKNRKKIMAVLALTLALACVAGGVLAKYVTSSTGGDSARVAYWGFDQSATIDIQMFDGTYDNVASSNEDNVIAPGTSKTTTFAFGYTPKADTANALTAGAIAAPEVAYTFTAFFSRIVVSPLVPGATSFSAVPEFTFIYALLNRFRIAAPFLSTGVSVQVSSPFV